MSFVCSIAAWLVDLNVTLDDFKLESRQDFEWSHVFLYTLLKFGEPGQGRIAIDAEIKALVDKSVFDVLLFL